MIPKLEAGQVWELTCDREELAPGLLLYFVGWPAHGAGAPVSNDYWKCLCLTSGKLFNASLARWISLNRHSLYLVGSRIA